MTDSRISSSGTSSANTNLAFLANSISNKRASRKDSADENDSNSMVDNNVPLAQKEIKDMTISDILEIVRTHAAISQDNDNVTLATPSGDAPVEEKLEFVMKELETTKRTVKESKARYQQSIFSLEKATNELQKNSQLLLQNKFEIQENKIESQRTRIELHSLKQATIDQVKNLNKKFDMIFQNYDANFTNLQQAIQTATAANLPFHKPKSKKVNTDKVSTGGQMRVRESSVIPEDTLLKSASDDQGANSSFKYKLAKPLTNVKQIWDEYQYGLYGQPSLKSLDEKYKNRWRYKGENTTYLRRRKVFVAIESCIDRGIPEDDAIEALERFRVDENGVKRTMAWLFDNLTDNFAQKLAGAKKAKVEHFINDVEMADGDNEKNNVEIEESKDGEEEIVEEKDKEKEDEVSPTPDANSAQEAAR